MTTLIPTILGMAAVTYIPRLVPFLFIGNKKIPKRIDLFLQCIPLAALGALIIPGAFYSTPELPAAGIAGMIFTLVYGIFRGGIIMPVLGSVATASLVLFFLF